MADEVAIPRRISWVVNQRRAHGYLVLEDEAFHLICLRDESETAAAVGQATARQFGLIGALVSAGVSGARELGRSKELQALYDAQAAMPVQQRLGLHTLSRTVSRDEVKGYQKGPHLAPMLTLKSGVPLLIQAESPGVHEAIEAWCGGLQIPVEVVQPQKMNRKLFWGLLLSPVALALLYVVICVPFALQHRARVAEHREAFDAFKSRARPIFEGLSRPIGVPLKQACGALLTKTPVGQQVGFVGELPPEGKALHRESYTGFPRYVFKEEGYSRWSEDKMEVNELESRWNPEPSFGKSMGRMLESPFEWSRVAKRTGLPDFSTAKLLLVARVLSVKVHGSNSYSQTATAAMAVKVADFTTGKVECEGDLSVRFPPQGRGSSVGLDFSMSQGIPLGLLLPGCGTNTTGICRDVHYYAE